MKITRCKLSKKFQVKLLEFFTAQVTARTAPKIILIWFCFSDLLGFGLKSMFTRPSRNFYNIF